MDMHGAIVPLLDGFSASAVLQSYSCTPFSEMHGKSKQNLAMAKNGLHEWWVWLHEGDRMHVAGCRTCRHHQNQ
jgi:hypothetical protein